MVYISTQSFQSIMRQPIMQTESALATAQEEVSSGVYSDLGQQLGGETSFAISLSQQSQQITAITGSNATTSTRLSATVSSLSAMMTDAQNLSNSLLASGGSPSVLSTVQTQAQSGLTDLVGQLNSSVGGQYIFAGINTQSAPMSDTTSIQAAATAAFSSDLSTSQSSGDDLGTILGSGSSATQTLFQGTGWTSLSSASSTSLSSQITPTQSITSSVSANNPAFQQIAQAYSMLNAAAGSTLTTAQTQDVVTQATSLLSAGIAGLTQMEAGIGVSQSAISDANTTMAAQQTILTQNVESLENVDTTSLATTVNNLSTQLQDSYSLTSQLKSLSLVNYLTAG